MWYLLWILWSGLIIAAGVYNTDFVAHSHWEFVQWVPTFAEFRTPLFWLDVLDNVVLFIPFSFLYFRYKIRASKSPSIRIIVFALILSCGIELYQVYSHNRRPSPVDIINDVGGAVVGLWLGRTWLVRQRAGAPAYPLIIPTPSAHTHVPSDTD
ncbi:MAG: VanZ family protein [Nitrospiraceae bacterium]